MLIEAVVMEDKNELTSVGDSAKEIFLDIDSSNGKRKANDNTEINIGWWGGGVSMYHMAVRGRV